MTDAMTDREALVDKFETFLLWGGHPNTFKQLICEAKRLSRKTGIDYNTIIDNAAVDARLRADLAG